MTQRQTSQSKIRGYLVSGDYEIEGDVKFDSGMG